MDLSPKYLTKQDYLDIVKHAADLGITVGLTCKLIILIRTL